MPDPIQPSEEAVEALARELESLEHWPNEPGWGEASREEQETALACIRDARRYLAAALPVIYADLRGRVLSDAAIEAVVERRYDGRKRGPVYQGVRAAVRADLEAALDTAMKGEK